MHETNFFITFNSRHIRLTKLYDFITAKRHFMLVTATTKMKMK